MLRSSPIRLMSRRRFATEKTDVTPIASQWILRRVAGNVSYQDLGRPPSIEWTQLANGVHKIGGSSHATIVVEMRDHLIAVEGPLYEARTAPVVQGDQRAVSQ